MIACAVDFISSGLVACVEREFRHKKSSNTRSFDVKGLASFSIEEFLRERCSRLDSSWNLSEPSSARSAPATTPSSTSTSSASLCPDASELQRSRLVQLEVPVIASAVSRTQLPSHQTHGLFITLFFDGVMLSCVKRFHQSIGTDGADNCEVHHCVIF